MKKTSVYDCSIIELDKLDAADKANVESELNALKEMADKADPENMTEDQVVELKAQQEKAMNAAQKLFEKMYEQSQAASGGAGPDMSGMGPDMGAGAGQAADDNFGDDVVDGDFKEV